MTVNVDAPPRGGHEPLQRSYAFRAEENAEGTTIRGYASIFGQRNSHCEVFVPGAFRETLDQVSDRKPLVMGWLHREPIGRWSTAGEDATGLLLEGPISDTQMGRDAATLVKDGVITGLSVGFWPRQEIYVPGGDEFEHNGVVYRQEKGTWYILKADLVEASLVMAPSDDEARLTEVRSAAVLDRVARALPAIADDEAGWEDVAYSMALLMGGRGAGAFADELDPGKRQALYQRLADAYARHARTPPPFDPAPTFTDVAFAHDERQLFQDRSLGKRCADVLAQANGVSGPLSAPTRQRALEARDALTALLTEQPEPESEVLARIKADVDAITANLIKE